MNEKNEKNENSESESSEQEESQEDIWPEHDDDLRDIIIRADPKAGISESGFQEVSEEDEPKPKPPDWPEPDDDLDDPRPIVTKK